MKKNQNTFGSVIDGRQILIGSPVQLFGYLTYLIFPPPDQTLIPHKSFFSIIIHNALSKLFVKIANSLLFLIPMFSFILIATSWLFYQNICVLTISIYGFLRGCVLELRKILNSSFLKKFLRRNILNFKIIPIFAISIFFITILSFNINYLYFLNKIYNDDPLICDTSCDCVDNNLDLSFYEVQQAYSNSHIIFTAQIKKDFKHPYVLTQRNFTRAPPLSNPI